MLKRVPIRALILGITSLAAPFGPVALAAPTACTGDASAKALLITTTKSAVWRLYPDSKKVFIDAMSTDLVSFYGATTQVFYWDLLKLQSTFGSDYQAASQRLGSGPIFGDAHFGNLGEYSNKGDKYYAINDVDDVTSAPRIYDLVRAAVSLVIRFPDVASTKLISSLVAGYTADPKQEFAEPSSLSSKNLIPEKTDKEPEPPKAAWAAAEIAFRGMTGLSQSDFDKNCRKFVYLPFHGGSSIGLPRFRVNCNDMTYELKACIASAADEAQGLSRTCNKGQAIAQLATELSPKFVGGFVASNSLANIREFAPFGFYGHLRTSEDPNFDDADEADILKIVKHFGKAIGDGHVRANSKPFSWTPQQAQQLQKALLDASGPMLQSLRQDFNTLPKCL